MFAKGGDGVPQDLRQAFDWCQRAADSEFAPAQATLAALFLRIDKVDDAVHWWTKAAQQGDSEAQYNLAILRSTGKCGAKDHAAAFQLFCQAAEQGLVNAQSRLGVLYATGEGVAMDAIEAHKWFIIAANAGDEGARENVQKSEALLGTMQILEAKRRAKLAQ
jgi:TPR repeat protein